MRTISSTSSSVIPGLRRRFDEGGALDPIDAARGRVTARLGLLDEARSSPRSSSHSGVALQRFAHDLVCARADLKRESASVAVEAFREGQD
jgi:hypothetical protein